MERRALPEQASRGHQSSDRFRMSRGVGIALLMLCMGLAMASPVLGQGAGASIEGTLRADATIEVHHRMGHLT